MDTSDPATQADPDAGRLAIWIYDCRADDGPEPERRHQRPRGPVLMLGQEQPDGRVEFVQFWLIEDDPHVDVLIPLYDILEEEGFVERAMAVGRLQRVGPVPQLPADSPHHDVLRTTPQLPPPPTSPR